MSDFKRNLKEHFKKGQLKEDQLAQLQDLMEQKSSKHSLSSFLKFFLPAITAAAIVLLLVNPFASLEEKIIAEVAKNHIKNMPVEIKTSNIAQANDHLKKLDFKLISAMGTNHLELIGARYCSIQGVTAAQLSYQDEKGQRYTVYQVPLQREYQGQQGKIFSGSKKGIQIEAYAEKDLMISIAR